MRDANACEAGGWRLENWSGYMSSGALNCPLFVSAVHAYVHVLLVGLGGDEGWWLRAE